MNKQVKQAHSGDSPQAGETDLPAVDLARRGFVQRSGKALYLVPALTLLGPARVSAQGSGCQPGIPGCPDAGDTAAPEAPAPTE